MEIIAWIIVIGVGVLALYLIRGVICWYFKINERIKLQKELYKLLEKQTNSDGNFREGSNTNQG